MEKKLVKVKDNYSIAKVNDVYAMSAVLKQHIIQNKLYANIVGKNYVMVEGWQFAGGLLGLFPRIVKTENLGNDKEVKWSAHVEIVNQTTGSIVSSGFAVCSNAEAKKRSFDEYAIVSMAQTRAIGKAYRNFIGWVMKLAGYEATPAEEMKNIDGKVVDNVVKGDTINLDADDPFPTHNPERKPVAKKPEVKKSLITCADCSKSISEAEKVFSEKYYNKMTLCMNCQKKYKKSIIK